MECRCLQVDARARREETVEQDCRMCRRSSVAKSVVYIAGICCVERAIFYVDFVGFLLLTLLSFWRPVGNDLLRNGVRLTTQSPNLPSPRSVVDKGLCKLHSPLVERYLSRRINQRTPRRWGYDLIEMHLEMISGAHLSSLR